MQMWWMFSAAIEVPMRVGPAPAVVLAVALEGYIEGKGGCSGISPFLLKLFVLLGGSAVIKYIRDPPLVKNFAKHFFGI